MVLKKHKTEIKLKANRVDAAYERMKYNLHEWKNSLIPYLRRIQRFFALPYAYFKLVNWKECTASRWQVAKDFFYIFFVLKDFPDYYTQYRWWEVDRSEWKYYYGSFYNPYQRGRLRKEVQRKEYEILFTDKYVCYQLCKSVNLPVPEILAYIEPKDNYHNLLSNIVKNKGKVVIKSTCGRGGQDIFLAYLRDNRVKITDGSSNEIELVEFKLHSNSIIQEYIQQHRDLSAISSSVNTIRTETLLTRDGDVLLLGAFIRFGLEGSLVDNQCAGGLSVGVNISTGQLKSYALDGNGVKYYKHPNSGVMFNQYTIPFWEEIVTLSKKIQLSYPYYKILGPDIAVTPNGPIIVEINATPDHAGFEMDYGPTLKDERIRKEFQRYNLLINRPIKEQT